jgi:hypothetical protein
MNEEEIGNFIDAIAAQNFNQAKNHFDDILGIKMNDALEQEKVAVANNIFNGGNEEEDFDFDDDDLLEDEDDDWTEDEEDDLIEND